MTKGGKNVTPGTCKELVIVREFAASRERVWKFWTEPELFVQWWGPYGFTTPHCSINLHIGGFYLNCMRSPDGKDYWSCGRYREVVPPSKIVCTDSFANETGSIVPARHYGMSDEFPLEMLITVTFEESSSGTRLTLRHEGIPDGEPLEQCSEGWNQSFDKLAKRLGEMEEGSP